MSGQPLQIPTRKLRVLFGIAPSFHVYDFRLPVALRDCQCRPRD